MITSTQLNHGKLTLHSNGIIFQSKADSEPIFWDQYCLKIVKTENAWKISHTVNTHNSYTVTDKDFILKVANTLQLPIESQLKNWFKENPKKTALLATTLILTTLVVAQVVIRTNAKYFAKYIPQSTIADYVNKTYLTKYPPSKLDDLQQRQFDLITHRLLELPEIKKHKIKVIISRNKDINAYAMPNNIIILNSGFIQQLDTPEELLAVLAHEIGHIKRKHVERLHAIAIIDYAFHILFINDKNIVGYLAGVFGSMTNSSYDRDQEREADQEALNLLKTAKISNSGFINFFHKLSKLHGKTEGYQQLFSTHPASTDRIKDIEADRLQPLNISLADLKKVDL